MLQFQHKKIIKGRYYHHKYIRKISVITKNQKNNIAFCRTNMLSDYIEKLSTDINMISYCEESHSDGCKYIAMVNACIIIGIMLYMFLDRTVFQSIFRIQFKMPGTKRSY